MFKFNKDKFKKFVPFIIILCFLAVFRLSFLLLPKEEAVSVPSLVKPPVVKYKTMKAAKGTINKILDVTGEFVSIKQSDYSFESRGGYIKSIYVKAGSDVKAGTLLAELDSDKLDIEVELQKIRVEKASLEYQEKMNSPEATAAEKKISYLGLEEEKLRLKSLEDDLAKTRIYSKISGRVVFVTSQRVGQYVNARETIVSVADPRDLQVEYSGDKVNDFNIGMKVEIQCSYGKANGDVVTVPKNLPDSDNENTKKYVRINFKDSFKGAKFGDPVRIVVFIARKDNVIVLPSKVVNKYEGNAYVQILQNNTKVERFVEVGLETDGFIEIIKGVNEGDEIITE